jgi:hypothetical protein
VHGFQENSPVSEELAYPRFASRGRTYVYVLPCRDEDILKVGFSRDPLQRLCTLHSRFFEFFDLERGLFIETDHLRDARRIERLFITTFADYRAPAPLVVPRSAGGHTEWYRGIYPLVEAMARDSCAAGGFVLHAPIGFWLRSRLAERSELLFGWSARMLDMVEFERFNVPAGEGNSRCENALREVLDAYVALGLDIRRWVPGFVDEWYQQRDFFRGR